MISTLRRVANAVLFVVACLLGADTANAIFAAVVLPPPEREVEAAGEEPIAASTWADRQSILDRNVFESSTLAPPPGGAVDEDLEATKLPLTLMGTAASEDPRLAWAAIQDRDARTTLIVGVGQAIQDKATVVRIERQRVVLMEGGAHRELAFDEDDLTPQLAAAAAPAPGGPASRAAARRAARLQQLSENTFEMPEADAQALMNNPAQVLSDARWLPKYEDGQMTGVQMSQIKAGSMLEQAGMQEGDLITGVNGMPLDSPEQSPLIMQQLMSGEAVTFEVISADGRKSVKRLQTAR
jgi:general secretion pathway protein C